MKLIVGQGQKDMPGGDHVHRREGTIFVDRGKITSTPEELTQDLSRSCRCSCT